MTRRPVRRLLSSLAVGLLGLGLAGLGLGGVGIGAAAAATTGQVYVVHGIVASTVSIVIDGSVVQAAVAPKSVVGPLTLAAGKHVIELRAGAVSLASAQFSVTAGDSLDVVAHRASDQAMTPVITVFRNDLSAVGPGKTRLVVSHVAVAPPADIRVDGKPFFRNVANGESLSLVVPAKTYSVDVVPTAGGSPILAPVRVGLKAGFLTRVFAIGSVADSSTDAIVQNLPVPVVGAGAPRSVHTGDGGQAADSLVGAGRPLWTMVALGLGFGLGVTALLGTARGPGRLAAVTGSRHAK